MNKMNMKIVLALSLVLVLATVAFAEKPKDIYTDAAPAPLGFYSQGIKFGNLVFVSGQIPIDPLTGLLVTPLYDTKVATEQVMKNIEAILDEAGLSLRDIIMTTVYLNSGDLVNTFAASSAEFNQTYGEAFGCTCLNSPTCSQWDCGRKPKFVPPARASVVGKNIPKNALIEVSVIAGK